MVQWKKHPLIFVSGGLFLLIVSACLLAPFITPYPINEFDLTQTLLPPSSAHLMGTDFFGRDIFTRFLYGGRVTLRITLVGSVISLFSIPLGLISGYFRGVADMILSRIFDAFSVLPPLLLIVFAETLFGYGEGYYQYALGIAFMPPLFRLTRTLTTSISGREFIEAARSLGASHLRILRRHILPNILPELLTQIIGTFSDILLYCTLLGYLNIGVKSPTPEWGAIIHDMFAYIYQRPLIVLFTSLVLSLCILSINLFGRGLRDMIAQDLKNG